MRSSSVAAIERLRYTLACFSIIVATQAALLTIMLGCILGALRDLAPAESSKLTAESSATAPKGGAE